MIGSLATMSKKDRLKQANMVMPQQFVRSLYGAVYLEPSKMLESVMATDDLERKKTKYFVCCQMDSEMGNALLLSLQHVRCRAWRSMVDHNFG